MKYNKQRFKKKLKKIIICLKLSKLNNLFRKFNKILKQFFKLKVNKMNNFKKKKIQLLI